MYLLMNSTFDKWLKWKHFKILYLDINQLQCNAVSFADIIKKEFKAKVVVCRLTYAAKQNKALGTSYIAMDFVPLLY